MSCRDGMDFGELIRRFDNGDRDEELMATLNRVAFEFFHSPWEPLPPPVPRKTTPIPPPNIRQGRLPMGDLDDDIRTSPTNQGRLPEDDFPEPPSLIRLGQRDLNEEADDPEILDETETEHKAEEESRESSGPSSTEFLTQAGPKREDRRSMARLNAALEAMGFPVYHRKGKGLVVDLPYDPKSDCQQCMLFRSDREHGWFLASVQSDLGIPPDFEQKVEGLRLAYNQRLTGLEVKTYRPVQGARLRVEVSSCLPFEQTIDFRCLVVRLAEMLHENHRFWVQMRAVLS